MDPLGSVALLGDFSRERLDLDSLIGEFGWAACRVPDVQELTGLCAREAVVAILIQAQPLPGSLRWAEALRTTRKLAPNARAVICCSPDQMRERAAFIEQGAYSALMSPLNRSEVRQALGFVWAAKPAEAKKPRTTRDAVSVAS